MERSGRVGDPPHRRETIVVYVLFLVAYLAVQFGHGSNIGVAISLPGNSKAMNLVLGSWVMVGVSLGLPFTPCATRTFGLFRVVSLCVIVDVMVILMMVYPKLGLSRIYLIRFLVGFFEAPFLPYLQQWLARFGKHTWVVWNTILHAMVPMGESLGYIVAQELVAAGYPWQWAFGGQAAILALTALVLCVYGRKELLDLDDDGKLETTYIETPCVAEGFDDDGKEPQNQVEYPGTERWLVYWGTNVSLALQLGFLSGSKYVIRYYATLRGFSLHFVIFTFSVIALLGPALGGAISMSGSIIQPDRWSQHRRTLAFITVSATIAAWLAMILPYTAEIFFWPLLMVTFIAAGTVYPAAQGIINISLTSTRVVEASVYQIQCNNILIAMPLPYVIGKTLDIFGTEVCFMLVTLLQGLAAAGFGFALLSATCTEERSAWHRLVRPAADEKTLQHDPT